MTTQQRYGFIGIILSNGADTITVQQILSVNAHLIKGRMGIPHLENDQLSVITLIVSGTTDEIGSLTGKIGSLEGVSVKSGMHKSIGEQK